MSRLPAIATVLKPTKGRLEEKIILSNGFAQVVPAVQIVNGMFADTGDVSTNDPNDVKGAVAVPLISANTGVDAVRPPTPRVKSIAGRLRLADAYCERAGARQKEKKDAAIADYQKSIETGAGADGCSCDPYNPLLGLYTQDRRYDEAWEIVHKARSSKKWIAPELLDRLKKESGRSN